jgi:hypothetical protein
MYEFATVTLIGLAVATLVDLGGRVRDLTGAASLGMTLVLGLGIAWATDYSAFAGWGIQFREAWMGPVATGLAIAGMASVWRVLLDYLGVPRRVGHDAEPDARVPRAA